MVKEAENYNTLSHTTPCYDRNVASTKKVVYAALAANFMIAVLKFAAFSVTGSSSMLSEAYHSVSDTGNQVLLLLGIRMSEKDHSQKHPFGRGKEQYFFAFVVAVLLFGVAGYASLSEGFHRLGEPYHERDLLVNYLVLGGALVFESYALIKAYRGLRKEREDKEFRSILHTYRNTKDATLITAFTEDVVAVLGLVTASVSIYLSELTRNNFYDAAGSILIGVLLMVFSLVLAWENRGLIVGEGASRSERQEIIETVRRHDDVENVIDLRTLHLGADTVLVTTEVEFRDRMSTDEIEAAVDEIEETIREKVPEAGRIYVEAENRMTR
ncbi:MAG: cation diffusion facilitator family transporter [Halobacteria archaeon]